MLAVGSPVGGPAAIYFVRGDNLDVIKFEFLNKISMKALKQNLNENIYRTITIRRFKTILNLKTLN
jgi:hypothetical protein